MSSVLEARELGASRGAAIVRPAAVRLLAVLAACVAAWLTQAAVGFGPQPTLAELSVLLGGALLLVPIQLGLRLRAVLTVAAMVTLVSALVIVAQRGSASAWNALALLPPLFLAAAFVMTLSALPKVRLPRPILVFTGIAAFAVTAWPVFAMLGALAFFDSEPADRLPAGILVLGIAASALAWLMARAERPSGLRRASSIGGLRDALFVLGGMATVAVASLWTAAKVDRCTLALTVHTPLEGLAGIAGWAAGASVFVPIGWALWRLPRAAAMGQLRGRVTPQAVGESLWFGVLASAAALASESESYVVPGRACWIAVAAAAAFIAVRLALATPPRAQGQPLWIVFLQRPRWGARRLASRLASAWRSGAVTVLATPESGPAITGTHLRACARTGNLDALFPLRPVHLADWGDALPPPRLWQAMPVREFYAPASLWSEVLRSRLTADASVFVFSAPEAGPVEVRSVAVSSAPVLSPALAGDRLQALAAASFAARQALVEHAGGLQHSHDHSVQRRILILHPATDAQLAQRAVGLLTGERDAQGRTVEARAIRIDGSVPSPAQLLAVSLHGLAFVRRVIERVHRPGMSGWFLQRMGELFSAGSDAEYDVVILETGAVPNRRGAGALELLAAGVHARVLGRLIAVRSPSHAAGAALTFPPESYAGEIRLPVSDTPESRAEAVVRQLLALQLSPIARSASASRPKGEGAAEQARAAAPAAVPHPQSMEPRPSQRHAEWVEALQGGDIELLGRLAFDDEPAAALLELETYINGIYRGSNPLAGPREEIHWKVARVLPFADQIRERLGWTVGEFDLKLLRFIRRSSALSPVLGAGVSMGAGAPSWAELVRLLLEETLEKGLELREPVPAADNPFGSPLTERPDDSADHGGTATWRVEHRVREVRRYTADQESLVRAVLNEVQAKGDATDVETLTRGAQVCSDLCGQELFRLLTSLIYARAKAPSEIHRAIAKLAHAQPVPERGSGKFAGWDSIITYNFDALMSEALAAEGVPHAAWAMRGDELQGDPDERARKSEWNQPVFHLHGYTPRRLFLITHLRYVFSTSQYLTTYGGPASKILQTVFDGYLANPVHIVLYIGCSFADEAMNNLLRDASRKYPGRYHYALLKWPHGRRRSEPTSSEIKAASAKYLAMGVRPIWFDDFGDLPGLIAQLQ